MRKSIKGLTIFIIVSIILIAATFVPSVNAAAYDRYRLVDSWTSGSYKTCLYRNTKGQTKSTSISKGRMCSKVY